MLRISRLVAAVLFAALILSASSAYGISTSFITGISFADAQNGYLSGRYSQTSGIFGVSQDGGLTWKSVSVSDDPVGVFAWSASQAWGLGSAARALGTVDTGSSWTPSYGMTGLKDPIMDSVAAFDANHISVTGRHGGTYGGTIGFIQTSAHSGTTWSPPFSTPVNLATDAEGNIVPTFAYMTGIDALRTGGIGWAVGFEDTEAGTSATLRRNLVYNTTDFGSNWVTQTVPPASLRLTSVTAASAQTAYAAGVSGYLLKTTNGGSTWGAITGPFASTISAIDSLGDSVVVVVDELGRVGWSSNGGASWTTRQMTGSQKLRGVSVLSTSVGLVAGDDMAIYRTTDAGVTWTPIPLTPSAPPAPPVPPTPPVPAKATVLSSASKFAYLAYGGTGTFSGYLKADGVGVPNQTIVLQKSSNGVSFYDAAITSTTSSNGYFSLRDKPKIKTYYRAKYAGATGYTAAAPTYAVSFIPKVYLSKKPWASRTIIYHGKTYRYKSALIPRHTSGSKAVKLQFQRYYKGKYRAYKTVTAYAYNYSSYSRVKGSYKIPYKGKWRVRAFHDDAGHAATYSSWLYKTVK